MASEELAQISPSSINAFDESTPFGCERRWWFKYVLKNPEPQQESMQLGEALHKRNEDYLKTGLVTELGMPLGNYSEEHVIKSFHLFEKGRPWLDKNLKNTANPLARASWVRGVEMSLPKGFTVAGVGISPMSKCDVVVDDAGGAPGIVDWKTTSNISKYGKTPGGLASDTQMLLYARAFFPEGESVRLVHGQYETKGTPKFQVAEVVVSKEAIDKRLREFIVPLVERMKATYRVPAARDVKPNRNACFRCPHKGICPSEKVNPLMGIFDKFKAANPTTAPVVPPDAPASDPALAAKPIEGLAETAALVKSAPAAAPAPKEETKAEKARRLLAEAEAEERAEAERAAKEAAEKAEAAKKAAEASEPVKRGPGRPPGAKNKPKPGTASEGMAPVAVEGRTFTKTTVSFGLTLNLGDYNSARIDVQHTVEYGDGDAEAAFAEAFALAKQQAEEKAAQVLQETKAGPEVKR